MKKVIYGVLLIAILAMSGCASSGLLGTNESSSTPGTLSSLEKKYMEMLGAELDPNKNELPTHEMLLSIDFDMTFENVREIAGFAQRIETRQAPVSEYANLVSEQCFFIYDTVDGISVGVSYWWNENGQAIVNYVDYDFYDVN